MPKQLCQPNHSAPSVSRRHFLWTTLLGTAAMPRVLPAAVPVCRGFAPPIAVFSKIYRELGLSLEEAAALTAEVGLDGVDCPVRPKDEILPERVKHDLPRYRDLLEARGRKLLLLTTAILNPGSPYTRDILETARRLGVKFYRLGFIRVPKDSSPAKLLADYKPQLREVAAMNQDLGLCALLQNHSPGGPGGYLGGDLNEMFELVRDLDPAQVGLAFDLGHALLVHGDDWTAHFEKLKPHLRVAYIKDAKRGKGFVRFGEGEFAQTDFFTRLKNLGYAAPLSIHIEYDWSDRGKNKTREALTKALKDSLLALRQWCAAA